MLHVDLDAGQLAQGLARDDFWEAFALRKEYPNTLIPYTADEPRRWERFLDLDDVSDAIRTRFLSIDLQKNVGTLFYERNKAWCFEHRTYMTTSEEIVETGSTASRLHYQLHGLTEDQYLRL